jgi:acetyltransferase-like isoleucine patch superfamily enzyme
VTGPHPLACFIPEHTVLEDGAWIGPGVRITNARYPNRPDTKANLEGVTIGRGAVVGAAAVLLPGVQVGEGAIIGAGAVVVRDVAPGAVVVGNPVVPPASAIRSNHVTASIPFQDLTRLHASIGR